MPIDWKRIIPKAGRKTRRKSVRAEDSLANEHDSRTVDLPRLDTPEWQKRRRSTLTGADLARATGPGGGTDTGNPFTDLPTDLLFAITDHCSTVTILSLRCTSRRFHNTLPLPRASPVEKNVFWHHVKRDIFAELCWEEDATSVQPGLDDGLLCSACMTTHPPALFTPDQLNAPSRRRLCRGMHHRMLLCKHTALRFDEAQKVLHRGIACPHSDHDIPYRYAAHPQYLHRADGLRISTLYPIFRKNSEAPLGNDEFTAELRLDHRAICPHMQMKDVLLPSLFSKLKFKDGGTYDSLSEDFFRNSHRCMADDCQTKFRFRRTVLAAAEGTGTGAGAGAQMDSYDLLVIRKLGLLSELTDKKWLAQVEHSDEQWKWARHR